MRRSAIFLFGWLFGAAAALASGTPVASPKTPMVELRLSSGMRELAYRFSNAYWAANGANWELADYQLRMLQEALADSARAAPMHARALGEFHQAHVQPLTRDVVNQNLALFNRTFSAAVDGCNGCHVRTERAFLRYRVPGAAETGAFLDFMDKGDAGAR